MEPLVREALWQQYGAALGMLDAAIVACPEDLWCDRSRVPEFWYVAFHTLFWHDHYLSASPAGFRPPGIFGLEELDPAGVLPPRVYTKPELRFYLGHGREKCRRLVTGMTAAQAASPRQFGSIQGSLLEVLLYNLRHVHHHTGQLNLILRQQTESAPGWVVRARDVAEG